MRASVVDAVVYTAHSVLSCIVVWYLYIYVHIYSYCHFIYGNEKKNAGCRNMFTSTVPTNRDNEQQKVEFFCEKFDALNKNYVLPSGLTFKQAHQYGLSRWIEMER